MHIILKKIDGFGTLPSELSERSFIGSVWSFLGFFIITYLIVNEIFDFFQPQEHTRITMDKIDSRTLYIFFDVIDYLFLVPTGTGMSKDDISEA